MATCVCGAETEQASLAASVWHAGRSGSLVLLHVSMAHCCWCCFMRDVPCRRPTTRARRSEAAAVPVVARGSFGLTQPQRLQAGTVRGSSSCVLEAIALAAVACCAVQLAAGCDAAAVRWTLCPARGRTQHAPDGLCAIISRLVLIAPPAGRGTGQWATHPCDMPWVLARAGHVQAHRSHVTRVLCVVYFSSPAAQSRDRLPSHAPPASLLTDRT